MKRGTQSDHLSHSLTDLMTSLMVIFVLLLVTKLNNQASEVTSAVNRILDDLKAQRELNGEKTEIKRQGDVIVIVIPNELMNFQQGSAQQGGAALSPQGRDYLRARIPGWAGVLCSGENRKDIDTVVVEGHSDKREFKGVDGQKSREMNLELSQQRSMAVVAEALGVMDKSEHQPCFLDLLSATGRGDRHPIDDKDLDSPENRRVEIRIRVRPNTAASVGGSLGGRTE